MSAPSYTVDGEWDLRGGPYASIQFRTGQVGIVLPVAEDITLLGEAVSFVADGVVPTRTTGRRPDGLAFGTGRASHTGNLYTDVRHPRVPDVSGAWLERVITVGTVPADEIAVILFDPEVDPGVSPVQTWSDASREEVVRASCELLGNMVARDVTVAVRDHRGGRAFVASVGGRERTTLLWTPTYATNVYPTILEVIRHNVHRGRPRIREWLTDAQARQQAIDWA